MHWCCAVFVRRIGERSTPGRKCIFRILVRKYKLVHIRLERVACQLERMGSFVRRKILPWVGLVADFAGHYGSQNFVEVTPGGVAKYKRHRTFPGISCSAPAFPSRLAGSLHSPKEWWASPIFTPAGLCQDLRTLPSPPPSEEALIFGYWVRSRCAEKATTFTRHFSTRRSTISGCRSVPFSASEANLCDPSVLCGEHLLNEPKKIRIQLVG